MIAFRSLCELLRTPWSVRVVARRDEAEWFAQNVHRRRLCLSRVERELLFAGEHPLRFAFSLLALQAVLLVFLSMLPPGWFTPAWLDWKAAEQLSHFTTVWTIQATLAALVYPLDDLRTGVQAVGERKLLGDLWAEVEQKLGWRPAPVLEKPRRRK